MNLPERFGTCTIEDLDKLESDIGFELPEDYRSFLQNNNGGKFSLFKFYASIYIPALDQKVMLDVSYGYELSEEHQFLDIVQINDEFKEDVPENTLIFTRDPGGNMFLLVTQAENEGVYYWDSSDFFDTSEGDANAFKVADSFTDFLNKIEYEDLR